MKSISLVVIPWLIISSCKSSTTSKEIVNKPDSLQVVHMDSSPNSSVQKDSQAKPVEASHLKDTITMEGNFILFLQPDSARFASLEDEPGIYDGDSDFGVGISNTITGLSKSKNLNTISARTSDKRFINIRDCMECPVIIDRDTVNYGFILSGKGRSLQTKYNEVHSGDYLQEIKEYFNLKKAQF